MKTPSMIYLIYVLITINVVSAQRIGIGTDTPHTSSVLDVESTISGLLIPRMTETQKNNINSPANGLLIYQTDGTTGFWFFNGSVWQTFGGSSDSDWAINGNTIYNANTGNVGVGDTTPNYKFVAKNDEDGNGVMSIENDTNGGFAGIYFRQNDSYRGHIGYVNTGGTSGFGGKGTYQLASGGRDMVFSTSSSGDFYEEKMRLTTNGRLRLVFPADGDYWETYIDSFNDYNFAFNGSLTSYINDTDGSYNEFSDQRLKENISSMDNNIIEKILKLNPVTYNFIKDKSKKKQNGFIAQEVQQLFPELVSEKDGVFSLTYGDFGVFAIKAIQYQQNIISNQNKRLAVLEAEIKALKEQLK